MHKFAPRPGSDGFVAAGPFDEPSTLSSRAESAMQPIGPKHIGESIGWSSDAAAQTSCEGQPNR